MKENTVDSIARENSIATAASEAAVRADASLALENSLVTAANEKVHRQRDESARLAAAETQIIPDDEAVDDDELFEGVDPNFLT